jgi:hypothetical protein
LPTPKTADENKLPHFHEGENKTMDDIYQKGMIPMGKLKILPSKPKRNSAQIQEATPGAPQVTDPFSIIHTQHVKYDVEKRTYEGLPSEWEQQLKKQFGLPPDKIERMRVPGYKSRIPTVLVQMKDYLIKNGGLSVEGIFRIAPDSDESMYVKQELNENKFVRCDDVNCIANLIKVWFRDLPEPLLQQIPAESILECTDEEGAGTVINEMSEPNSSILLWLLDLCIDVSSNSGVNKMTPQNLAIVCAPNLFKPPAPAPGTMMDPTMALTFSQKVAAFLHSSIQHRKKTASSHKAQYMQPSTPHHGNNMDHQTAPKFRKALKSNGSM